MPDVSDLRALASIIPPGQAAICMAIVSLTLLGGIVWLHVEAYRAQRRGENR